jgi:hypothetical protein
MGQCKNGKRRGPPTWARGTQLTFLDERKSTWQNASSAQQGRFYTNCTWLFIKKYGWELRDNDDADPDKDNITTIRQELSEEGDEQEQAGHDLIYKKLRKVSECFY